MTFEPPANLARLGPTVRARFPPRFCPPTPEIQSAFSKYLTHSQRINDETVISADGRPNSGTIEHCDLLGEHP